MKTTSTTIAVALALLAAVPGCGTFVSETPLNIATRPLTPRSPACVEVFSSAPPARPHVDLALLDVWSEIEAPLRTVWIQRLRERGGQMGCDAIFIGTAPGAGRMQATCVVYNEPSACTPPVLVPPPRRTCHDRQDFDTNRNCILAT